MNSFESAVNALQGVMVVGIWMAWQPGVKLVALCRGAELLTAVGNIEFSMVHLKLMIQN